MKRELLAQLKALLLAAAIWLPVLAGGIVGYLILTTPAFGWTYCIEIGGGMYCWDFPDE